MWEEENQGLELVPQRAWKHKRSPDHLLYKKLGSWKQHNFSQGVFKRQSDQGKDKIPRYRKGIESDLKTNLVAERPIEIREYLEKLGHEGRKTVSRSPTALGG